MLCVLLSEWAYEGDRETTLSHYHMSCISMNSVLNVFNFPHLFMCIFRESNKRVHVTTVFQHLCVRGLSTARNSLSIPSSLSLSLFLFFYFFHHFSACFSLFAVSVCVFFFCIWIRLISFGIPNDRQYMYATNDDVATLRICYLTQRKKESRKRKKERSRKSSVGNNHNDDDDDNWQKTQCNVTLNDKIVECLMMWIQLLWAHGYHGIKPRIRRKSGKKRRNNTRTY